MKNNLFALVLALAAASASAQSMPWQQVQVPPLAEVAANFKTPPREDGAIHWSVWGGQQTKERLLADIENLNANGCYTFMINNSASLDPVYLSPEYMDLVKFVVDECKKRGMKVWIEDEGGYPSGFAGGIIKDKYPELAMQGIVADAHVTVEEGQKLDMALPVDTLGIVANPRPAEPATDANADPATAPPAPTITALPIPADGKFQWTAADPGSNEIVFHGTGPDVRYSVVTGQTLRVPVPEGTKGIDRVERVAPPRGGGGARGGRGGRGGGAGPAPEPSTIIPVPADGRLQWTPPSKGTWELTFVRHIFRSSPTNYSDRADGRRQKDGFYTLIDYLNPEATKVFLNSIHETYAKVVGDEFGKTILGFRSDEDDYTGFSPWTPKLLETFKAAKGYDLAPYIAEFYSSKPSEDGLRAKADYWDVWSAMFRDNFYKPQEDWCEARGMVYMTHLNHEENMVSARGETMITNEGDFWRDMRTMGVPGIDNLSQISPGVVADFPMLASSAAHLYGRPQTWTEAGGSTGTSGKFVADYQFVRGINYMNIRGLNGTPPAEDAPMGNPASRTAWYINRASYLLTIGRPAAQIAMYHPVASMWAGDIESNQADVKLTTELMEHQIDFDHIDGDTIAMIAKVEEGGLKNLSGQVYRGIIVPSSSIIPKAVLDRLREFAKAGGKVVFVGRTPETVVDKTFLHPEPGKPDLSFATLVPDEAITPAVVAALPKPDVALDSPCPPVKYIHRSLKDAEVYFFFNESKETQVRKATLAGTTGGVAQVWNPEDASIAPLAGATSKEGVVSLDLALAPYESKFIVVGPLAQTAAPDEPSFAKGTTVADLSGDWTIAAGEKNLTSPLKSLEDLGVAPFPGIVNYSKTFTLAANAAAGKRLYLECDDVHEVARPRLNGTDLAARDWSPYRWDVTKLLKDGENKLEIGVQASTGGGRRGGGAGGGGRGARAGRAGGGQAGTTATANAAGPAGRGGRAGGRGAGAGAGAGGRGGNQPAEPAVTGLLPSVRLVAE